MPLPSGHLMINISNSNIDNLIFNYTINWRQIFLPPANEVWGKVIFLHLFVILFTGGHAWLPGGA